MDDLRLIVCHSVFYIHGPVNFASYFYIIILWIRTIPGFRFIVWADKMNNLILGKCVCNLYFMVSDFI